MSEKQWEPTITKTAEWSLPITDPSGDGPSIGNRQSEIENPEQPLLDLAAKERWVAVNAGGNRYVHHFAPLTAEDWLAYDRALRPTLRVGTDDSVESSSKALLAAHTLWQTKLIKVEGYSQVGGIADVPLRHIEEAVKGLGYVGPCPGQLADWIPDTEDLYIVLEGLWNGVYYDKLLHIFKRPLVEHELRFQEALRRSAIVSQKVGGQRRPQKAKSEIVSLPNLPTMIALYDELIVSTTGYAGSPMDALHKSCAVRALFNQNAACEVEVPEDRSQK